MGFESSLGTLTGMRFGLFVLDIAALLSTLPDRSQLSWAFWATVVAAGAFIFDDRSRPADPVEGQRILVGERLVSATVAGNPLIITRVYRYSTSLWVGGVSIRIMLGRLDLVALLIVLSPLFWR
ncbi:MAG: hypothetical protein VX589_15640 [Myxococcota bacterium]|nr:hypothetical protein [Myxococcota bacterium]